MDINKFQKGPKTKKEKIEQAGKLVLEQAEEMKDMGVPGIPTSDEGNPTLDNTSNLFSNDETELTENEIQKYLDYFETLGITKNKIFEILDTLLTKGEVLWAFKLLNRIPVVFRLRPAWVNDELLKVLDERPSKTLVGFTEIISKYNLAGSLQTYDSTGISVKTKEELDSALLFIGSLPYIIRAHLVKQLSIFDRVMAVATSDWALENFSLPQQGK